MTTSTAERTQQVLNSGDRAAWLSAALAVALDISSPNELRPAALEVLRSGGIDVDPDAFQRDRGAVAAQAAAPLLQSAALLRGDARVWADQPDQALLAQPHRALGFSTSVPAWPRSPSPTLSSFPP